MQKYQKKPVVIEAVQYLHGVNDADVLAAVTNISQTSDGKLLIPTLEGTMVANDGDWIIKGIKGEFYPVKPDIFEASYGPATDAEAMRRARDIDELALAAFANLAEALGFVREGQRTDATPEQKQAAIERATSAVGCSAAHFQGAIDALGT